MYKKEACYLSVYGKVLMLLLLDKGLDQDLALEVLHLLIPNSELYDLSFGSQALEGDDFDLNDILEHDHGVTF